MTLAERYRNVIDWFSRNMPTVLVIIIISSLCIFEAMLNRQMGTQFIALVYCLLILSLHPSRNGVS